MRNFVAWAVALGMIFCVWTGAAASRKKSQAKKSATVSKSTKANTTTAAKRGKKPVPAITWRNRQTAPTPERYREIQEALSAKGYLGTAQVNGQWTSESTEALRKFQADQNLEASGKINSLSLIALGLGPKHETGAEVKPPPQAPAATDTPVQHL